ncbi:MAG: HAD family hydrolase [Thermoleophilia bacterium]|nr:HAD family hydrolase [Thermoleophilia bacterium]
MRATPYRIDAVIFDFDGTLTRPGALDFEAIRRAIGCPPGEPILEFLAGLPPEARRDGQARLDAFEAEAAAASQPNDGAEGTVHRLRAAGVRVGVISRNSLASIKRSLRNFAGLSLADFEVVVSRDTPASPKPAPDGLHLAAELLGLDISHVLMVGDHAHDMAAGAAAGALTALLVPQGAESAGDGPDFLVRTLAEVEEIVSLGRPLPQGKLPKDLLEVYLSGLEFRDPSVLVAAGVGGGRGRARRGRPRGAGAEVRSHHLRRRLGGRLPGHGERQ